MAGKGSPRWPELTGGHLAMGQTERRNILLTGREPTLKMMQFTWQRAPEQVLTEQAEVYTPIHL